MNIISHLFSHFHLATSFKQNEIVIRLTWKDNRERIIETQEPFHSTDTDNQEVALNGESITEKTSREEAVKKDRETVKEATKEGMKKDVKEEEVKKGAKEKIKEDVKEDVKEEVKEGAKEPTAEPTRQHRMMQRLIPFFEQNYRFRYNLLTEQAEFAPMGTDVFRPVTQRAMNAISMSAFNHDVECWDKDIRRYIESDHVPEYHPFADYLDHLPEWDGVDRVTPLAERVSRIPIWTKSFHTWMLALTNQWMNAASTDIDNGPAIKDIARTPYANSVAPILISTRQGLGKSTFCKRLLPAALSRYYTDSYDLNAPSGCEQKLAAFGLVNLDEFDKLSVHKMPQLKNLMQMNSLNIRKAYQKSVRSLPRIASFIGTSNRTDLLADTTGSRRFLCIEVDEMIDNLTPIDYDQLYAQLKQELAEGARCYFTKDEEARIEAHNRYYYRTSPIEEVLHDHVEFTAPNTEGARLLSAAQLFQLLQKKNPAAMRGTTCYALTRLLPTVAEKVHTRYGNGYWMKIR